MKCAVLIANLGGPTSLDDVQGFLYSLFSDRHMINLPAPVRQVCAFLISRLRKRKSTAMYAAIGGGSPIIKETMRQAAALESVLGDSEQITVFACMRYGRPSIEEVVEQIKALGPKKLVVLPLYPQRSISTTDSLFDVLGKILPHYIQVSYIGDFHDNKLFVRSHSRFIRTAYDFAVHRGRSPVVLFSAHGIPCSFVDKRGDVYEKQVECSVKEIVGALNICGLEWRLSYQSRVGRLIKWLSPYTCNAIKDLGARHKFVIVVPISFVSDNLEVNYELDIVYKKLAIDSGASGYFRVSTLGVDELFINALAMKVKEAITA